MKILVTFAVRTEFAAWRRQHDFRQVSHDPFEVYAAEIGGNTVRVLLTGIGANAAEEALRWALVTPADLCISSGFAGALSPQLSVGNVLAARVAVRAERELAVASDREMLAVARRAGAQQVDRFLTSERLVVTTEQKAALAHEADAVDMESFVILAEAARHGVRAVAVRATSDAANVSLPYDFDRARDGRGRIRMGAVLADVLRQPRRIPDLLRLVRDCRLAAGNLANFLDGYLQLLDARLNLSQSEMVANT
jgi:adenosylhomocysteine nucleosidase